MISKSVKYWLFNIIIIFIWLFVNGISRGSSVDSANNSGSLGAFYSGVYKNLFVELLNKNGTDVNAKLHLAFKQLFYGHDETERIYYPVEPDMAYIEDINNDDVRTEGMSYGMMVTVQLNKKEEFNRLWKWAKTFMQHKNGPRKNYFAWHCNTDGAIIDSNSASDGEEWFVTSLFFASARWGDGIGIYKYSVEAQKILDAMLNKREISDGKNTVTNMFNKVKKQVVFVPSVDADNFTDPSYHLPHFYELWARWADKENQFWYDVTDSSRNFLMRAANPVTGLYPDYANFDGTPLSFWGGGHENFQYDAWRVAMNVAVDYSWFAREDSQWYKWAVNQSNRLLDFFYSKGIDKYKGTYTLDGKALGGDHSTGLIAMNAVACLSATNKNRRDFVEELWNAQIPTGHYRYYDGILYMLGLLQASGNFRIYKLRTNEN